MAAIDEAAASIVGDEIRAISAAEGICSEVAFDPIVAITAVDHIIS
jgi:hypothetical protein